MVEGRKKSKEIIATLKLKCDGQVKEKGKETDDKDGNIEK